MSAEDGRRYMRPVSEDNLYPLLSEYLFAKHPEGILRIFANLVGDLTESISVDACVDLNIELERVVRDVHVPFERLSRRCELVGVGIGVNQHVHQLVVLAAGCARTDVEYNAPPVFETAPVGSTSRNRLFTPLLEILVVQAVDLYVCQNCRAFRRHDDPSAKVGGTGSSYCNITFNLFVVNKRYIYVKDFNKGKHMIIHIGS